MLNVNDLSMLHTPKHDLVKVFLPSLTLTPSDFIPSSSLNFLLITQKLGLFIRKKKGCFELVTKKGFLLPNFVPFYNLFLFTKKVIFYTGTISCSLGNAGDGTLWTHLVDMN